MTNLNNYTEEELLKELNKRKREKEEQDGKVNYEVLVKMGSPIGTWEVTTEGDEEGRTTKHLGTFNGHLVDIAVKLSGAAFYSLNFKKPKYEEEINIPKRKNKVDISLDIDTGSWNLKGYDRIKTMNAFLNKSKSKNTLKPLTNSSTGVVFEIET